MNGEQDNEDSTTTQESVVEHGRRREQQQTQESVVDNECGQEQKDIEAVIVIEEDKYTEKQKENNDVPALNAEQDSEDSTTTQESVVDVLEGVVATRRTSGQTVGPRVCLYVLVTLEVSLARN